METLRLPPRGSLPIECEVDQQGSSPAGICEQTYHFLQAFALQSSGRNCYPAPDLVLWWLIFPGVFFTWGVFFSQTPVGLADVKADLNHAGSPNAKPTPETVDRDGDV